jgi:hypothetical protein
VQPRRKAEIRDRAWRSQHSPETKHRIEVGKSDRRLLTIRNHQLASLARSALSRFEEEMTAHVKALAPWFGETVDASRLLTAVRHGRERASEHGFFRRGPVRLFIELSCIFGVGFDTDPQYKWAVPALETRDRDELARADRLHAAAMTYIEDVNGPDNVHAAAALRRMLDGQTGRVCVTDQAFDDAVLAGLRCLFPEKCAFVGEPALRALIAEGTRLAAGLGAVTAADQALIPETMFMLGHGFASDPYFPWTRPSLAAGGVAAAVRFAALRKDWRIISRPSHGRQA